jgi:hypothetical protein
MSKLLFNTLALFSLFLYTFVTAQLSATSTNSGGYVGYTLLPSNDPESAVYDTASTSGNTSLTVPEPDVFLNATVFVGEISLDVENITAKVNLEAQVLNLLYFNAGVDASIDRVTLLIQNISAHVILEARLVIIFLPVESFEVLLYSEPTAYFKPTLTHHLDSKT